MRQDPVQRGFTLIRYADCDDILCPNVLRFQHLSTDIKRRVPDIFRVVLDPAICRKMLLELLLGDARWFALWREQDRS